MVHNSNLDRAMEAKDHFKNEASSRNLISKGNIRSTMYQFAVVLVVIVSSCDYGGEYFYYIENGLKSDTVTIKTHIRRIQNEKIKDSVFVLLPNERKLTRVTYSGIQSKNEHPSDNKENVYWDLGEFEVFINNIKFEKPLWEREYWNYTTEVQRGTYLLVIDEQIKNEE